MKKKSDITVVICNYNYGKYIKKNILSFTNQTCPPKKIIIIDDGSSDNSASVIKYLSNKYSCVEGVIYKNNKGVIYRMNQSLKMIKTKYFLHFGADDFLINSKCFELMTKAFNAYPSAGLCSGLTVQVNSKGKFLRFLRSPILSKSTLYISPTEIEKTILKNFAWINTHPALVNLKYFKKIVKKYPNTHQYTDIQSFYKIAFMQGAIFIPKIFGAYTLQVKQWSKDGFQSILNNKNFEEMINEWKKIGKIKNIELVKRTFLILAKYKKNKEESIKKFFFIKYLMLFFSMINFFFTNPKFFIFYHFSRFQNKEIINQIKFFRKKNII